MTHEIKHPSIDTWYIALSADEEIIHYGCTCPPNVTTTGMNSLESYTDKQEYIDRLLELGLTLEEVEEGAPT